MAGFDYRALIGDAAYDYLPQPETQQLLPPRARSRMQVGPITMAPTGEEWIDELINRAQPAPAPAAQQGISDEALLAASVPEQEVVGSPAEQAAASRPPPDMGWISQLTGGDLEPELAPPPDARGETGPALAQQAAPPPVSRVDMLKSLLQRPGREDGVKAALFDGLFGGSKYSDDLKARRNAFDAQLANAAMGDAAAADHAAQAEAQREQFLRQDETQRRGQDMIAGERREDRATREEMARANDLRMRELTADRIAGAEKNTRINKGLGTGGGGPADPAARAAAENNNLAAWLMQQVNGMTREQAIAYANGDESAIAGLPKEKQDMAWAAATNFRGLSNDERQRVVKTRLTTEGNVPDQVAAAAQRVRENPKEGFKIVNAWNQWAADVARAERGWNTLSDDSKRAFSQLAGQSKDGLAAAVLKMRLSPEEQAAVANIQQLANVLIKARSGSAVTGHEWGRTAGEIGFAVGDWDIFNSTAGISNWIARNKQNAVNERNLIKSHFGDLWKGGGSVGP